MLRQDLNEIYSFIEDQGTQICEAHSDYERNYEVPSGRGSPVVRRVEGNSERIPTATPKITRNEKIPNLIEYLKIHFPLEVKN